jgi:hypothetical protein
LKSLCNSRLPDFTLSQKNKCSSVSLYICLSSSLSLSLSVSLSFGFSKSLCVRLSLSLYLPLPLCMSVLLSATIPLTFCRFFSLFLRLDCLFFSLSTYYITANLYICLCLYAASILCLFHRYGKKNRLLKVCYVPATSATF